MTTAKRNEGNRNSTHTKAAFKSIHQVLDMFTYKSNRIYECNKSAHEELEGLLIRNCSNGNRALEVCPLFFIIS